MIRNRRGLFFAGVLFALLFAAASAHAAEEGSNAAVERAAEIFKWINFAIVAGVIVWLFGKVLPPMLRKNAESISSAIRKATEAKAAADALLLDAEAKLANLEKEVAELRAFAEREASAEVTRISAATRSDLQKIAAAAVTRQSVSIRFPKVFFVICRTRACPQLSQMIAAARWIAARKFLAVLS